MKAEPGAVRTITEIDSISEIFGKLTQTQFTICSEDPGIVLEVLRSLAEGGQSERPENAGGDPGEAGPGGRVERFDEVVEERRSRVDGEVARERDAGPQALCRERVRSRGASEGQPGEEH